MVVHWHVTFLRQGQVCFHIHLYGKNVQNFIWLLLWSLWASVAQISFGASFVHWSKWLPCPYIVKTFKKSSSPEPNKPWALIFAKIIGDRRSTKIAKMMVQCWRLTFLPQGQIWFPMHLYGPYTFILEVSRWLVDQRYLKPFWLEI